MYYIMDGHEVKKVDCEQWGEWVVDADRIVRRTTVGDVLVSTVFLSMDPSLGMDGPPPIFESMVFGGEHDKYEERYFTWDEAVAGHESILEMLS